MIHGNVLVAELLRELDRELPPTEEQQQPCSTADPCGTTTPPLKTPLDRRSSCLKSDLVINLPGANSDTHSESSSPSPPASDISHAKESSSIAPTAGWYIPGSLAK